MRKDAIKDHHLSNSLLLSDVTLHTETAMNLKKYRLAKSIQRLSKKGQSLFFSILYDCSTLAFFWPCRK